MTTRDDLPANEATATPAWNPDAPVEISGAICLMPPGTGAHCATACEHKRCALVREAAGAGCMVCQQPNGYRRPVYWYRTMQGHAECVADAVEKAMLPISNIVLKQQLEELLAGRSPPSRLAGPGEEGAACPRNCEHDECASHRAVARAPCFKCAQRIGYQRPFVMRVEGFGHADCAGVSAKVMERTKDDVTRVRNRELHRLTLQESYHFEVVIPVSSRPRRAKEAEAPVAETMASAARVTPSNPLHGRWRIDWTAVWHPEAMDLRGPAFIEFEERSGRFKCAAIEGELASEYGMRSGSPIAEFSWTGTDDAKAASGRGWATLDDGGTLRGRVFVHRGEDSEFTATRSDVAPQPPTRRQRAGRKREKVA